MDEYKEIVEYYNETLIFKFSSIGYALNCDLIFTDRLQLLPIDKSFELLKYLKDGNKILINITSLIFMENLQSKENSHECITKAIESSVTPFHFDGCQNLIRLFATKWE